MKFLKFNSLSDIVLAVSFFSILNNGVFDYGLRFYVLLPLFYLIFTGNFKLNVYNNILGYELFYFFILFIIVTILIPYNDSLSNLRTFTQRFHGRYITQFIRFALELGVSQFYLSKFRYDKIKFCSNLYTITLFSIFIGVLDFVFFNGTIYNFFLGQTHVSGRFTGLNIEPRMFGITLVYVYCFLSLNNYSNKILIPIFFAVILTFSISSIIILLIVFFYLNKKNKSLILFSLTFLFVLFTLYLIPNIDNFSLLFNRLDYLLIIKSESDYLPIFSVFEIFDRAALNSLFNDKIYLFTGFGPNTISIPSSNFIPDEFNYIYNGMINSVPHSGFVNILSRSGVIITTFFLIKFLRSKNFIFFMVYLFQANFIFYTFYSILYQNENEKK